MYNIFLYYTGKMMKHIYMPVMMICLFIALQGSVMADETKDEKKAGAEKKQKLEQLEKELSKSAILVRMRELYLGKRYSTLNALVHHYRKKYPSDHRKELYFYEGAIYESQGDYRKAAEIYLEAIRLNPEYSRAHNSLANLYCRLHQYHFAEKHFLRALEVNPYNPFINFNLGSLYYDIKEYQKSAAYLDRAIKYKENFGKAYHKRGLVHYRLKEYSDTIKNLEKAIEYGRKSHTTYYYMGMSHYHVEQGSKAIENLENALRVKNDFYEAAVALGDIHKNYGEFAPAIKAYARAVKIKDDSKDVKMKMIQCYNELRYYNHAIRLTKELLAKDPGNPELKKMLEKLNTRYLKENLDEPNEYMGY